MKYLKLAIIALTFLLGSLTAFGNGGHDSHGAQLFVDDDQVQCPSAAFTSIQAAVTAANAGDTINVCPGTYTEQVVITKSLTVQGISVANMGQALVKPPSALTNSLSLSSGNPIAAIILVDTTSKVNLTNLTVDGGSSQFSGCANPNLIGVYYRNASGTVDRLAVRNLNFGPGSEGCQAGIGIFVQSGGGGSSNVSILNCSVHDYQKNGIVASEARTNVLIKGCAVTGIGATPNIAQNGIQVSFGAVGTVDSNSVINHVYAQCTTSGCGTVSTNILIFNSNGVKVTKNTVGNGQVNIYYGGNKGEVSSNVIFQAPVFDGIDLVGDMNRASWNNIFNSGDDGNVIPGTLGAGVYVLGSKNEVSWNAINEAPFGIFEDTNSSGSKFTSNSFFNTKVNVRRDPIPPFAPTTTSGRNTPQPIQP